MHFICVCLCRKTLSEYENFLSYRWDHNTYGYHGDDGVLYYGHAKFKPFGPTFTTGDTIGAGINYASQEFFFTYD